jgi:radical SAM superfamily enzyme YgiQ (UPF0313 family)
MCRKIVLSPCSDREYNISMAVDTTFERPDIIRPPSEHDSYFLPVTSGCSNNTCTFCNVYYGSKLRVRDVEDVKEEVDAMAMYMNHGIRVPGVDGIVYALLQYWNGKRIFLQDGDALVYPFARLKEVLEYVNEKFPRLERITAYATPQDILRKSVDELKALKKQKLDMLYMGIESGDDEVLKRVCKNATTSQMIEAGRRVKEAGIMLSVTVILGLGGKEGSKKHARETARVLTEIDPEYAGALTLMLVPGSPLYDDWQQGKFEPIGPWESLNELRTMVEESDFTNCFFSSMHASNYLSIRGSLPRDKAKMLAQLDNVLQNHDPQSLRHEFLRGM